MGIVPQLKTDETVRTPVMNGIGRAETRSVSAHPLLASSRLLRIGYSFADQALAVGCSFLVNVALARTQTKEEYGMFALSYSFFIFLSALHNSAILEPCTVYGSGRYRERFPDYLRLMLRANAFVGFLLTILVLFICLVLHFAEPQYLPQALLGLGISVGFVLSGTFLRRMFYLQQQPSLAARASLISLSTVACILWLASKANVLNGFSVFIILALGWIVAALGLGRKLDLGHPAHSFLKSEPGYWREHWQYSKWVFLSAFVFQFTTQGYYWIVAGFLSVKEVAELRATQMLVVPMDQVFIALSFLVIPALAAQYASNRIGNFLVFTRRYGITVLSGTALFVLAVRVVGWPVMHWLYNGKFDNLASLLYILAFLPLLMGIGSVLNCALNAAERPRFVFYAYLSSGAATLLGGIPLVIHFGLRGAAYGLLLSAATYATTLALAFRSCFYGKARE
jgi:O-antigen/teichoic acid export membrane protein